MSLFSRLALFNKIDLFQLPSIVHVLSILYQKINNFLIWLIHVQMFLNEFFKWALRYFVASISTAIEITFHSLHYWVVSSHRSLSTVFIIGIISTNCKSRDNVNVASRRANDNKNEMIPNNVYIWRYLEWHSTVFLCSTLI